MSKSTGQVNIAAGLEAARDEMNKQATQLANQGTQLDILKWLMVGLVIVLLLGLGGIIQSYLATKTATYQSLVDKVNNQKEETDKLNEKLDGVNTQLKSIQECQKRPIKIDSSPC